MIESSALSWALVALFSLTAVHGLLLCSRAWSARPGTLGPDDKPVAFAHLAMSLAMIAMVYMWGGHSAYQVQLIVFGALGGYFLLRAGGLLRFGGADTQRRKALGYHALMAGSMVWMVAAMTTMTGHVWAGGPGGHDGHAGGSGGAEGHPDVEAPSWTVVVTLVLIGALAASTVAWAAARPAPARVLVGSGAPASDSTLENPGPDNVVSSPVNRLSGLGHALMSAGMIAMLLVMI